MGAAQQTPQGKKKESKTVGVGPTQSGLGFLKKKKVRTSRIGKPSKVALRGDEKRGRRGLRFYNASTWKQIVRHQRKPKSCQHSRYDSSTANQSDGAARLAGCGGRLITKGGKCSS